MTFKWLFFQNLLGSRWKQKKQNAGVGIEVQSDKLVFETPASHIKCREWVPPPLPIQRPTNMPERQQTVAQVLGFLQTTKVRHLKFLPPGLAWCSPTFGRNLENLSLCSFPTLLSRLLCCSSVNKNLKHKTRQFAPDFFQFLLLLFKEVISY